MPRRLSTQASFFIAAVALVAVVCLPATLIAAEKDKCASAASKPLPKYAGSSSCATCHDEIAAKHRQSQHGKLMAAAETASRGWDCEGCHGPAAAHADNPTEVHPPRVYNAKKPDSAAAICLSCHAQKISPAAWRMSQHSLAGVQCWQCHSGNNDAHQGMSKPRNEDCLKCHQTVTGQFSLNSHHPVREGRVNCADCHSPHRRMNNADYVPACVRCHVDIRGPFIYTHGALESRLTDVCQECHQPHGSPNGRMLKLPGRGLCLQCHADKAIGHFGGRNCSECHGAVHGSNHDKFLFRP